jgi:hypothetical protein
VFELQPEDEALSTITLEQSRAVTTMRIRIEYPNQQVRDATVASGMESGLQVAFDHLEELIALHP